MLPHGATGQTWWPRERLRQGLPNPWDQSLDTDGIFDPQTGLLTRDSFWRDLKKVMAELADRSLPLSVARFSFASTTDERARLDATRLMTRLIRNIDFAVRDEDGAILIVFT